MILERRSYLLRPGQEAEFWAFQRDWYWPPEIGDFFGHLVGYFETIGGDEKRIIHLYRFDSLAQWEAIYGKLYRRFPPSYFSGVRQLLLGQENTFLAVPPLRLPTVGELSGDVGRPQGFEQPGLDSRNLVIRERVTQFLPGGLFAYWEALNEARHSTRAGDRLIGFFSSMSGPLHRAFEYRWHENAEAADRYDAEGHDALVACRSHVVDSVVSDLTPAPFPWLRPLFEPMDWKVFEARDASQRRIDPWPAEPSV